ncbi:hypothetical protein VTL71DRAFT_13922 [Oculimacula yallundae]|uniref:Uncharacterized protein n=1 Tax=Oculimacula yallundae TaxID=86028 RepID=A0ABR4CNC8_9HELO
MMGITVCREKRRNMASVSKVTLGLGSGSTGMWMVRAEIFWILSGPYSVPIFTLLVFIPHSILSCKLGDWLFCLHGVGWEWN